MDKNEKTQKYVALSAIDPVLVSNIPEYSEDKARGKGYINYGKDNLFPNYL